MGGGARSLQLNTWPPVLSPVVLTLWSASLQLVQSWSRRGLSNPQESSVLTLDVPVVPPTKALPVTSME